MPTADLRDVVDRRRELGSHIGRMAAMLGNASASTPSMNTLRSAVSELRHALADHQASWPAVSIEPSDERFRASTGTIRPAYDAVEAALADLERDLTRKDPGDRRP